MHKYLKPLAITLLLGFYAGFLFQQIALPVGDDIGRHIKNGELLWQGNTEVLYSNVFSYALPGYSFVNHHWLSGVVFYLVHEASGWDGIVYFKVIVLLAAFALLFRLAVQKGNFWLAVALAVPAIILLGQRNYVRPEIFSYLFIALYLYILNEWEKKPESKLLYTLIPLQVLWVNMHIFFPAGPALAAVFLLGKLVRKDNNKKAAVSPKPLYLLLGATMATCLLNPNGIAGATAPFRILNDYGMEVIENQSMQEALRTSGGQESAAYVVYLFSVLLFAVACIYNRRHNRLFYLLAGTATALAGFYMIRLMAFFPFIFLPAVTTMLTPFFTKTDAAASAPVRTRKAGQAAPVFIIVLLCCLVYLKASGGIFTTGKQGAGLVKEAGNAAEFFRQAGIKGPVFNDYDIGSYLIYYLYPKEKVFLDNRPEAYPSSFIHNEYLSALANEDAWNETDRKHGFNVLFFYLYDKTADVPQFLLRRIKDAQWTLVYADNFSILMVKNTGINSGVAAGWGITPDNIAKRMETLRHSDIYEEQVAAADIFNLAGRGDLAMETYFNVVNRWPDKGRIWMVMGEKLLVNDNFQSSLLAMMYLDKAISTGYKTDEAYRSLALAYMKLGVTDRALEALEKAASISPGRKDLKDMLRKLKELKR